MPNLSIRSHSYYTGYSTHRNLALFSQRIRKIVKKENHWLSEFVARSMICHSYDHWLLNLAADIVCALLLQPFDVLGLLLLLCHHKSVYTYERECCSKAC